MNRVSISTLKKRAELLSELANVEFDIEAGSRLYGRSWKLVNKTGSKIYLYAESARELYDLICAFSQGILFLEENS